MIRELTSKDIHTAINIWYAASVKAHPFIEESFWSSHMEAMRTVYLPMTKSWVYEAGGYIRGFLSYHDGVIKALFVNPDFQSQGIGSALLHFLKQKYQNLTLAVYAENQQAFKFYTREGFTFIKQQICEHTGHKEIFMCWTLQSQTSKNINP